jgi:TPR repeat protein
MSVFQSSTAEAGQFFNCQCCGRNLAKLDQAIYCPGCGQRIRRKNNRRLNWAAILYVLTLGRFPHRVPGPTNTSSGDRTPILIGYGNAMFNLGWRYERGSGTCRNLPEAMRCYKKSARLGNMDATVRLAVGKSVSPPRSFNRPKI